MVKETTFNDKKETAVSTATQSTALAVGASVVDIDPNILQNGRFPFIKLLQKNSDAIDNGEQPGTFYNDLLLYNFGPELQFIPLKAKEAAFYIPKNERKLVCRSDDGVTNSKGEACKQCPYGVYHRGPWVDSKSPACHTTVNLYGLDAVTGMPGVMVFKVKSLAEGQKIAKQIAFVNKPVGILIGVVQEKNDSGIFYVPKTKKLFPLTQEQYEMQKQWIEKLRGQTLETAADESEAF